MFLKRLRERVKPIRFRYFLVGEYGDLTERPHYHAALFGLGREAEPDILAAWGKGLIHVGDLTQKSAQYVAGYVTKKMTQASDPRLKGRYPEFARMSRMPAIGSKAIEAIAASLNDSEGAGLLHRIGDAPGTVQHGGRKWPLGRVLKEKLRLALGFDDKGLPDAKLKEWLEEMHTLRIDKKLSPRSFRVFKPMVEHQKIANAEAKAKIWKSRSVI